MILFIIALSIFFTLAYSFYRFYIKKFSVKSPYDDYRSCIKGTYRVGFTNLDKEVVLPNIPTIGIVPSWLTGTLLRNGPAKFTQGKSAISNWFDGLAMVHGFTFDKGQISYTNKFLKTHDYEYVQRTGTMSYAGFLQDPCVSIFQRFFSLFIKDKAPSAPNANVNIVTYNKQFLALTETPLPIHFDKKTLDTLGVFHYRDAYPEKNIHESAHPHYDPLRKEHVSYLVNFGATSEYVIYRIKDGTTQRQPIATVPIKEPSYMHSFAITENYAILTAIPLVVNPLDLLFTNKAFIKNYKWKPKLDTECIVIDRIHDKVIGKFQAPSFFYFHHINAYEDENNLIVDVVTYPNSEDIAHASMKELLDPKRDVAYIEPHASPDSGFQTGSITRLTFNLDSKELSYHQLSDALLELPRINYDRCNGKDYTYVYGVAMKSGLSYVFDALVKINVKTSEIKRWSEKNCYPGEPVFVASPESNAEDDGIILSIVLDATRGTSYLLILDAQSFTEIGRACVPHHIPFGIHGIFTK